MERAFTYPEHIPTRRALAVIVLFGPTEPENTEQAWAVMREWAQEEGSALLLKDVASILEHNGLSACAQARVLNFLSATMKLT